MPTVPFESRIAGGSGSSKLSSTMSISSSSSERHFEIDSSIDGDGFPNRELKEECGGLPSVDDIVVLSQMRRKKGPRTRLRFVFVLQLYWISCFQVFS